MNLFWSLSRKVCSSTLQIGNRLGIFVIFINNLLFQNGTSLRWKYQMDPKISSPRLSTISHARKYSRELINVEKKQLIRLLSRNIIRLRISLGSTSMQHAAATHNLWHWGAEAFLILLQHATHRFLKYVWLLIVAWWLQWNHSGYYLSLPFQYKSWIIDRSMLCYAQNGH